jgi:hypothetical protein
MIPTEEEREEQWVQDPSLYGLGQEALFLSTHLSPLDWVLGEVGHKEEKSQAK